MLFNLLLIFCFYLPFQIALNPSAGIDLASGRIFIILLFFLWLADGLKNKKLVLRGGKINFFIFSFLFLGLFSLFFVQNVDWAARKLLFLFSIFPVYFIVSDLVDTKEKMEKIIKTLVWSGFFVAMLGIIQFISQFIFGLDVVYAFWATHISPIFLGTNVTQAVLQNPSWLVNVSGETYLRAVATFPDPHMLSFFLGMILPFSLGLFFKLKNKFYLFAFFAMLICDILTFSRGGYLGLFFGFLVVVLFLWNKLKSKHNLVLASVVILAGIFLTVPGPISQRFFSSFNLSEGSNSGRLEIWKQAGEVILAHPFFGTGIGNYPLEIKATADYREPIYAHSNYLDIAAETGLPNLAIWLGLLGVLFFIFLGNSKKDILFFCAGISVIIFSTHSMVETSLYSPIILPLFLIIAGISFSSAPQFLKK